MGEQRADPFGRPGACVGAIDVAQRLERRELAEMLRVERDTVDRWLLTRSSPRWLEVPDMALELLAYKLAERQAPPLAE